MSALSDFWRRAPLDETPYVHPEDDTVFDGKGARFVHAPIDGFDSYVDQLRDGGLSPGKLHLDLIPQPYIGDLDNAKAVLLLLNPGVSHTDYFIEGTRPDYRERMLRMIAQEDRSFLWLDPELCWTSGFGWWESKLSGVMGELADARFSGSLRRAREELMREVASIELVPYHSKNFAAGWVRDRLESSRAAREFVRDTVLPAAAAGDRTVIVTRSVKKWGVAPDAAGVVAYDDGRARGASIGPETEGGRAILRRLDVPRK